MQLKNKVLVSRYLSLSVLTLIVFNIIFIRSTLEAIVFLGVWAAILINNALLYLFIWDLLEKNSASNFKSPFKKLVLLSLKMFILGISLAIGVHFIGDKIITSLINYIIHIFILIFCVRRSLNEN